MMASDARKSAATFFLSALDSFSSENILEPSDSAKQAFLSVRRTRRSLSNPFGSPFALVVVAVALSPPRTFSARLLHNKRRSLFQSVHSRSLAAIYIEHNCLIVEPLSVAIATKQQQQQKIYSSTPSFVRFHFSQ